MLQTSVAQRLLFHLLVAFSILPEDKFMLEGLFQPTHLLIIAAVALLIFGPKKLPQLGRGLGEGIRGFKSAIQGTEEAPVLPAAIHNASDDNR